MNFGMTLFILDVWGILKRWISDEKHKKFNYRKCIKHYGC
ncbi:hypothetical protein SNSL254_A0335 [Salmonella enterica subsp. enterica serovar Newport str. SL254]|uniref:Uncharacterized protein n=1 Tax=Salmonella newport (strain SL254) TaxID=423368 RepID=A0A0H3BSH8_SALNS|nr:hypothetical protein SNSL254_A0335 [Salmonella enterica subsp. enterica serovar Newport str. SL254]AGS28269.1 hypothetical protein SN31241_12960 [Salmonella enterica subsp. enterica serovar Newport str. USMARC-S3124.1]